MAQWEYGRDKRYLNEIAARWHDVLHRIGAGNPPGVLHAATNTSPVGVGGIARRVASPAIVTSWVASTDARG